MMPNATESVPSYNGYTWIVTGLAAAGQVIVLAAEPDEGFAAQPIVEPEVLKRAAGCKTAVNVEPVAPPGTLTEMEKVAAAPTRGLTGGVTELIARSYDVAKA